MIPVHRLPFIRDLGIFRGFMLSPWFITYLVSLWCMAFDDGKGVVECQSSGPALAQAHDVTQGQPRPLLRLRQADGVGLKLRDTQLGKLRNVILELFHAYDFSTKIN